MRNHLTEWIGEPYESFLDTMVCLRRSSHKQREMKVKITRVAPDSATVGPDIYKGKSETPNHDTVSVDEIPLDDDALEEV